MILNDAKKQKKVESTRLDVFMEPDRIIEENDTPEYSMFNFYIFFNKQFLIKWFLLGKAICNQIAESIAWLSEASPSQAAQPRVKRVVCPTHLLPNPDDDEIQAQIKSMIIFISDYEVPKN